MSEQQKRFDALMQRVIKVSPEELKRRLKAKKTAEAAPKSEPKAKE
jgi:hypothetical protein